jgi:hypothetical protein
MSDVFFENVADSARFRGAIRRFDELNACDPNLELVDGEAVPRELLYAHRLSDWVMRLAPSASEALRLASRCQHLCRWTIPRSRYEMTRAGYHQWKNDLKRFHAERSTAVLREVGYDEPIVERVRQLNLKRDFPTDPEVRVIEDALCLVFLQFQFAPLAARTDDEKVINALQKSWNKMTPAAREHALKLDHGERERRLLERALHPAPESAGPKAN